MNNTRKAYRLTKLLALLLLSISFGHISYAQSCLTNNLRITTGEYNLTMLANGMQDPNWYITTRTGDYAPSAAPGTHAVLQNNGVWGSNTAAWIVDVVGNANPGLATPTQDSRMTFRREFRTCENGEFTFTLNILNDDYVVDILVDGASTGWSQPLLVNSSNFNGTGWNVSFTQSLSANTHYLDIVVESNFSQQPSVSPNLIGLSLYGNIAETGGANVIVDDQDANCTDYECSSCSNTCFWKVQGNQILNGNNVFGTMNDFDINIVSNRTGAGIDRGVITGGNAYSGGYLGWNTYPNLPTARFHVNCINGNDDGSGISDIRFENLESGTGNILTINDAGYVLNSGVPIGGNDWHLTGNFASISDYLGTNNNEDLRFYTLGAERMVIKQKGLDELSSGFVGINEPGPTARLHVDCINGNGVQNSLSDIRFENLESGTGDVLAIDRDGYVYNTNIDITTLGGSGKAWLLTGNNALPGDYLGTNNDEDLRLNTIGQQRMVIKGGPVGIPEEGFVGVNTPAPSARFHVDCDQGNGDNGNGNGLSDVRFENLESGEGDRLVIDDQGYVYRDPHPADQGITATCNTQDMVPKWDASGNLDCSIIYDDGASVGINTTGPFTYINGIFTLDVAGDVGGTTFFSTSDARYKTNIEDVRNAMDIINKLEGKKYDWNELAKQEIHANNGRHYGFIAQEVEKVIPEAVIKDNKGNYAVEYNAFIPILTEATQELYEKYEAEKAKNLALESRLNDLEQRLNALENKNNFSGSTLSDETGNKLYQNTPNPFGQETSVRYSIKTMEQSAFIIVYDLNGREIVKYPVEGDGSITVQSEKLQPGMYLYSLVIDGAAVDTKRMVFSN